MSGPYAQNKKSIYNYRLKNLDKVREIARLSNKRCYHYKKECLLFRMILIDLYN